MSNDPISVTTRTSWISRLGSAFGGVLTGLALILASIALLAWNEGRSVQSIRANKEGAGAVQAVSPDRILSSNEGRLIHVSAPAVASDQRRDAALGVSADGLILTRKIEYYQWIETGKSETRTRLGGGEETVTTYSYDRQWTATPADSSRFQQPAGHQNPAPVIKNADFRAERARLGAFTLDGAVLDQVVADRPLPLTPEQAATAASALSRPTRVVEGAFYVGADPAAPEAGDMRVTYLVAPQNSILSVVGAQTADTLQPYPTRAGAPILMVRAGTASADQMFAQAKAANQTMSWVLRGLGLVVMIAAFGMVLAPLGVLADVVPLFGSIIRTGTGLVAAAAGLIVSLVVIALAWFVYRPLIAITVIAVAAACGGVVLWRGRRKPGQARTANLGR